jgi:hypothetical protein
VILKGSIYFKGNEKFTINGLHGVLAFYRFFLSRGTLDNGPLHCITLCQASVAVVLCTAFSITQLKVAKAPSRLEKPLAIYIQNTRSIISIRMLPHFQYSMALDFFFSFFSDIGNIIYFLISYHIICQKNDIISFLSYR